MKVPMGAPRTVSAPGRAIGRKEARNPGISMSSTRHLPIGHQGHLEAVRVLRAKDQVSLSSATRDHDEVIGNPRRSAGRTFLCRQRGCRDASSFPDQTARCAYLPQDHPESG